jgi:hypothetical protein
LAQRFGHFDLGALENADEFEGVYDGFALVVIVGDDVGVFSLVANRADALDPGIEFIRRVKIVVAFVLGCVGIVVEPGIVAPAMKADVADGRSDLGGRLQRAADDGLVDVAKACVIIAKECVGFRDLPGSVAQFDNEGIVTETSEYGAEILDGLRRAVEGKRELQQDGAELVGFAQNVEALADGTFIFWGGGRIVSEFLPHLRGEDEGRIGSDAFEPEGRVIWIQGLVEGSVDLDGIKEAREIGGFVKILRAACWIHVAGPIAIGPTRGSDAKSTRMRFGIGRFLHWRRKRFDG